MYPSLVQRGQRRFESEDDARSGRPVEEFPHGSFFVAPLGRFGGGISMAMAQTSFRSGRRRRPRDGRSVGPRARRNTRGPAPDAPARRGAVGPPRSPAALRTARRTAGASSSSPPATVRAWHSACSARNELPRGTGTRGSAGDVVSSIASLPPPSSVLRVRSGRVPAPTLPTLPRRSRNRTRGCVAAACQPAAVAVRDAVCGTSRRGGEPFANAAHPVATLPR